MESRPNYVKRDGSCRMNKRIAGADLDGHDVNAYVV
jgi:hypothetical protein